MLADQKIVAFVLTTDAARAQHFYETVLGLRFVADDSFALVFDANGTMLRVVRSSAFNPFPSTVLGWEVDDIENMVDRLTESGVQFERYSFMAQTKQPVWTAPDGTQVAWFKDPDGNVLSLSKHAR